MPDRKRAAAIGFVNGVGIRQMLIRKNKRLAAEEDTVLEAAERTRIEEAAMLQGISFDQALKKRKGFRYLY
ncbi:hypothetical protein DXG01_007337 [Tephrocybe rancida]|nr:hypothetical protein DXG01_007337 [Tephrocybe rancida]